MQSGGIMRRDSKSPFIRFEIERTLRSGIVLFLTSEVLPPLFLAPIQ
jgi:hypothetical protein